MPNDNLDVLVDDNVDDTTTPSRPTSAASTTTSAGDKPKSKGGRPAKWAGSTDTERKRNKRRAQREERLTQEQVARTPLDDLVPPSLASNNSNAFRYDNPDVSLYLAKVVFGCEMDYLNAAKRLRPTVSFEELQRIAIQLRQNEHVVHAMEFLLKQCGLDDGSRDEFVRIQWQWFRGEDKELRLQAARILSKIYFDKAERAEQPQPLKMEGFDEGMKRMLSDAGPQVGSPGTGDEEVVIESDSATVLLPGRSE